MKHFTNRYAHEREESISVVLTEMSKDGWEIFQVVFIERDEDGFTIFLIIAFTD